MKPSFIKRIVELFIERCEYSLVVDRKNIELTLRTYLWDPFGDDWNFPGFEDNVEDYITYVQQDLREDKRVKFVYKEDEFEYEGRKFTARANYIVNKKYDTYLEALLAEIEGR